MLLKNMKAGRLGMKNKEDLSEELANLAKNHAEIRPPCTKKSMVYENVCRRANNDVSRYPILVTRKFFSWQKISRIFTALCQNWANFP